MDACQAIFLSSFNTRLILVGNVSMNVIECGRLIDGVSEKPVQDARILVNDDGRIEEVGDRGSVSVPDEATVLDHSEEVVIPGLIDAHVHLAGWRSMNATDWVTQDPALGAARATRDLSRLVDVGFTTVRDVGSRTGLGLKQAVVEDEVRGPRVFTSELGLSQTAGHEDVHFMPYEWLDDRGTHLAILADGVDECLKETRKQIRKGVDLIKIQTSGGVLSEKDDPEEPQYTPAEIEAITNEAHRVNIPVAAHAQHSAGIKLALENGVDTIEHGFVMDDETIDLMLETDAVFVPTMWAIRQLVEHGDELGVPEYGMRKAREAVDDHVDSIRRAHERGVPIALGTDIVGARPLGPHGNNAEEAKLYVEEIGMSEMEAIQAATRNAAETIPADDIGVLQEGYVADAVVLSENPLDDIGAIDSVEAVYKEGGKISS